MLHCSLAKGAVGKRAMGPFTGLTSVQWGFSFSAGFFFLDSIASMQKYARTFSFTVNVFLCFNLCLMTLVILKVITNPRPASLANPCACQHSQTVT